MGGMKRPRLAFPREHFRWGVRALIVAVGLCAVGMGGLRLWIDSYRHEWEIEQRALAAMRRSGARVGAGTRPIGPAWLRAVAGPGQAPYFERIEGLFFVASDSRIAARYRADLKHVKWVFQD